MPKIEVEETSANGDVLENNISQSHLPCSLHSDRCSAQDSNAVAAGVENGHESRLELKIAAADNKHLQIQNGLTSHPVPKIEVEEMSANGDVLENNISQSHLPCSLHSDRCSAQDSNAVAAGVEHGHESHLESEIAAS